MNTLKGRHTFVTVVAMLFICVIPSFAAAQIPQFDEMYVFGDSLVDNGNILIQSTALGIEPPVPPSSTPHHAYFDGRFSNGYIGFEYLWQRLTGRPAGWSTGMKPFLASLTVETGSAVDFAFGGTGTPYLDRTPGGFWSPGLLGQVELFRLALHGRRPSEQALYAIATGPNDYRVDAYNVPMKPEKVVGNIEEAIVRLYHLGARHVMVLDMADQGLIPATLGDPNASAVSAAHNQVLKTALAAVQTRYPGLHLIPVELDPLLQELSSRMESHVPAIEAFAPGMSACLFINPTTCHDVPGFLWNANLGFLFWDVVHPTTEAHAFLADYLYEHLATEYEE